MASHADRHTRFNGLKLEATELVAAGQYEQATRIYREAISVLIGRSVEVLGWSQSHGMVTETYIKITDWQRIALMRCCNGIVQCRAMLDDLQGVRPSVCCVFLNINSRLTNHAVGS
jgi:hypothetical protein